MNQLDWFIKDRKDISPSLLEDFAFCVIFIIKYNIAILYYFYNSILLWHYPERKKTFNNKIWLTTSLLALGGSQVRILVMDLQL